MEAPKRMCKRCEFKIQQLLREYVYDTQKMLRTYCEYKDKECFYSFIQWVKEEIGLPGE